MLLSSRLILWYYGISHAGPHSFELTTITDRSEVWTNDPLGDRTSRLTDFFQQKSGIVLDETAIRRRPLS